MKQLMMLLFAVVVTTLMGSAVVVVLTLGMNTMRPIMAAAAVGFLLSLPVCWFVAHQILKHQSSRQG